MKKLTEEKKDIVINMEDPEYNTDFGECVNLFKTGEGVEINCPTCKKN